MQRTIVTCGIIAGAFIVLVAVGIVLGGMYMSRPLPAIVIPPPPPLPADNGFDDCVRAVSMLKETDKLDDLDPAKQPREADALVKINRPALDLVRKALPKDYMTPQVSLEQEFPYLRGFRHIGKLFLAEGQLKESAGDLRGAMESYLNARRFGVHIPNGGSVIHMLVGRAVSESGFRGLESVCAKLDSSGCDYVLKEMAGTDALEPSLNRSLEWERVIALRFLRDLHDGKVTGNKGKPGPTIPPAIDRILGRGRSSLEDYESHMSRVKTEASKSAYLRKPLPEPKGLVSSLLAPSAQLLARTSAVSTREQILKLMIALRHYRLEHSTYPESLAGLESYGIGTVDEFSGRPLVYKRTEDGYLLYSVGPDGKDDGGKPLKDDHGDIVAGKMSPPKAHSSSTP